MPFASPNGWPRRQRVLELTAALEMLDRTIGRDGHKHTVVLGDSPDDALHIEHLSITQQNGVLMIEGAHVRIARGEKILVKGELGTGKSTLIRAMAGLWPWGTGKILRPRDAHVAFLPQQPYIPLGTLRQAITYPTRDPTGRRGHRGGLRRCGLAPSAAPRRGGALGQGAVRRREAAARLHPPPGAPPDIVIMDEATSALDERQPGSR